MIFTIKFLNTVTAKFSTPIKNHEISKAAAIIDTDCAK
jgi:hypothetical protein